VELLAHLTLVERVKGIARQDLEIEPGVLAIDSMISSTVVLGRNMTLSFQ
jgi:hypothetical protein